jgi:hypothetical protein
VKNILTNQISPSNQWRLDSHPQIIHSFFGPKMSAVNKFCLLPFKKIPARQKSFADADFDQPDETSLSIFTHNLAAAARSGCFGLRAAECSALGLSAHSGHRHSPSISSWIRRHGRAFHFRTS